MIYVLLSIPILSIDILDYVIIWSRLYIYLVIDVYWYIIIYYVIIFCCAIYYVIYHYIKIFYIIIYWGFMRLKKEINLYQSSLQISHTHFLKFVK